MRQGRKILALMFLSKEAGKLLRRIPVHNGKGTLCPPLVDTVYGIVDIAYAGDRYGNMFP